MSRTIISVIQASVCVLVLGVPALAGAAGVKVPRTIDFATAAPVRSAIRQQCNLQTIVPAAVAQNSPDATLVDGRGNLSLEITEVHGPGGGPFSGPKWMAVTGKLHQGSKVLGSFRAKRLSTGGFVRGTCATLGRCAQTIGRDIAAWLKAPTMDAELGDAR